LSGDPALAAEMKARETARIVAKALNKRVGMQRSDSEDPFSLESGYSP
jgi:hypothetical protein